MKAAWYERCGPADQVLVTGEHAKQDPGEGEVRIRLAASGVNPGDIKKRQDTFGYGMSFPRVIPHSDGAGIVDSVGRGANHIRLGDRVWCFGAQSYRPFGTAAEYVTLPANRVVTLPPDVPFAIGACLGIPGLTAHRAVHVGGDVAGKTVLVHGGAGAVGQCAVALARHSGADVISTARSDNDMDVARRAGARAVVNTKGLDIQETIESVAAIAPDGIDHIVEVAFHANIAINEALLGVGGSVASYASGDTSPTIPFWPLVFKNISLFFLGSDDFPHEAKLEAALAINEVLESGWSGPEIGRMFDLESVAMAHLAVEDNRVKGRIVLKIDEQLIEAV